MNNYEEEVRHVEAGLQEMNQRLEKYETRQFRSEINRLFLLAVHAYFAVVIGVLFIFNDFSLGASWRLFSLLPWPIAANSSVLILGGLLLSWGLWRKRISIQLAGMSLVCLFYVFMTSNFTYSLVHWLLAGGAKPSTYAAALYCHFTVLLVVHLYYLWVEKRHRWMQR